MKPKFAYLYVSFIISLVILVTLSFLFYQRLDSHLKYSKDLESSYRVIFQLKELEKQVINLETFSRGYMLVRDSSFLQSFVAASDSIPGVLNRLTDLLTESNDQVSRLMLMKTTISNQVNGYNSNIQRAEIADSQSVREAVMRGKSLMDTFRLESRAIEKVEIKQREELYGRKTFYESIYPNYFNTILIFAGLITLVSFFFINREVRIRERYQSELEKRLHELNRSNAELEQFAYVASHDLQEPLRKIRIFGDRLLYKHKEALNPEAKQVIDRMDASARRLQELIHDMLNFTTLINKNEKFSPVNLNSIISSILIDFKDQVHERKAIIKVDSLPQLVGSQQQLLLLFKCLFDNAFKFSKPGESPVIHLSYSQIEGIGENQGKDKGKKLFHKIIMEDKGIGFDNEFADRIFMIFQRLHTQQSGYRGKGIGLAIAQRIMINHNGLIIAKGMVNDGAAFIMYFPVEP